jgi:hypothetical protein
VLKKFSEQLLAMSLSVCESGVKKVDVAFHGATERPDGLVVIGILPKSSHPPTLRNQSPKLSTPFSLLFESA